MLFLTGGLSSRVITHYDNYSTERDVSPTFVFRLAQVAHVGAFSVEILK